MRRRMRAGANARNGYPARSAGANAGEWLWISKTGGEMNWFGSGGRKPKPNGEQWIEMQTYVHRRPSVDGQRGEIENPQGSTTYDRNPNDLTVHGIVSEKSGGGTSLMHQIALDAQQMGKPFVRTTMTAPSAFGFYHRMGMLPSQHSKAMGERSMANTHPDGVSFPVGQVGRPGRLNQQSLDALDLRIKTSRMQWEAPTDTVLRKSSGR